MFDADVGEDVLSALITLLLLVLAIACFVGGWLAPELVALLAAGLLMATGVLTPTEALAGFGSPALITLVGLFVLSNGLLHSGALDRLRELLASPRIRNPSQLMLVLGFVVAPISGFIPNTPIVAILLPVVQGWCQRRGISPSRVLMPLSFATLIGGTITLIGTSTSLLASDLVTRLGYGSYGLFSFTAIGIPVWLIGACYLVIAGRFLPDRGDQRDDNLQALSRDGYLTEVVIPTLSPLCGVTLYASRLQRRFDVDVLDVHRDGQRLQPPLAQLRLQASDRLLLRCSRQELLRLQQDRMVDLAGTLLAEELPHIRHTEVLVPSGSFLAGATLCELRFRQRFNATVLAVNRANSTLRDRLGRVVLREGDMLLLQAPLDALRGLQQASDLVVLDQLDDDLPSTHRKGLAISVMLAVLLLAGFKVMPLVAAVLVGVAVLVIGNCLDAGTALRSIRWDLYLLLGGLYSFSVALQKTGLADQAASSLLTLLQHSSAFGALLVIYAITLVATELLSNAAAVALVLPIAAAVATGLEQQPMLFATAVVFAASQSFLSPIGYQTNLMVYAPGRYHFLDFFRFGWPLSLAYTLMVPILLLNLS
ncbi:SLC13 family permease [Synechococcus sp. MIT S9507]|uniref:SLC13 family permease n=1 Tax=Synechococcus sp. MIT S9507 TaxID=3082544 RepID=UPI0039B5CC28